MTNTRLAIIAYSTCTGLGVQTRAYFKHLHPSKTMVVDLSGLNGMEQHPEWYPGGFFVKGYPSKEAIDQFLVGVDVLLVAETPLNYYLFERARQLGIKIVQAYNYEFLDYLTPTELRHPRLPRPDVFAAPTKWNIQTVQRLAGLQAVQELPVPIDLEALPQRTITQARCFFHIAGRPAIFDRNGTLDFIQAARIARHQLPDAEFILYCQQPTAEIRRALVGSPVTLVGAVPDPSDMFRHGDVLVLPRRYGGLCLPAQEAVGCGIPVLMTNISPNNTWLPTNWLVPVKSQVHQFAPRGTVNVYSVNVQALAARMLALYRDDAEVRRMHAQAREIAARMSWEALLSLYEKVLTKEVI